MTASTAAPASLRPGPDPTGAERPPLRRGLAWLSLVTVCLARGYRAFLLTLVAAAIVPMLWNWHGYVVRSGSMEPRIGVGDVVVAAPFGRDEKVPVGRVMVIADPARPQDRTPLIHRIVSDNDNGTFLTKGDANRANDSTPVPRENVRARAVLLVPLVGRPVFWGSTGSLGPLAAWVLLTAAAFYAAAAPRPARRRDRRRPEPPEAGSGTIPDQRLRKHPRAPGARSFLGLGALSVVLALAGGLTEPGAAAYSADTRNSGSRWAVLGVPALYSTAVLADGPLAYYRLEEASGSVMADSSGNGRTGTYAAVSAYRQVGALSAVTDYAVSLAGATGRLVSGGAAVTDPNTFSLEMWIKTSTNTGGKLIGFESTRGATSPTFDRHLFMRPDGRIVFEGGAGQPTTTPLAYNDGRWHHVVLAARQHGAFQDVVIYVDGAQKAGGSTAKTTFYSGWWRAGYGSLPTGTGYPASANFTGTLDEVAIYSTELTAARVLAHYAAR